MKPSPPRSPEPGKLFVGGVPSGTGEDALRSHFQRFGEVAGVAVPKDPNTGRGRGFAFVRFASADHADLALAEQHVVNGRRVDVKKAEPRGAQYHCSSNQICQHRHPDNHPFQHGDRKKIFIGGLPLDFEEDKLRDYFRKFGDITDAVVVTHPETKRSRGFGFVAFDSEECVNQVVETKHHYLYGARVEVKRAKPKDSNCDQGKQACSSLSVDATPFYPEHSSPRSYVPPLPLYMVTSQLPGYSNGVHFGTYNLGDERVSARQPRYPYLTAIPYYGYSNGNFTGHIATAGVSYQQTTGTKNGGVAQNQVTIKPAEENGDITKQL